MKLFKTVKDLQYWLTRKRKRANSIGFVPTMGALHAGHVSLVQKCRAENDVVVVSIFVNPTQFNEAGDLNKYPRTPERDFTMLAEANCDVIFMPSAEEVYAPDNSYKLPDFSFGELTTVMEGAMRPGHFEGVVQVVHRLLHIVQPDRLYMGQKDFQQFSIIASMLRQMESPIELVRCPIVREPQGLAMSSRNMRLTADEREQANAIWKTLRYAKRKLLEGEMSPASISEQSVAALSNIGFRAEYFAIVNATTLQSIPAFDPSETVVICVAVWVGDVRLIDNVVVN